ncbi:MAG TPA: hypothetical protein P5072_13310 [Parvularculaceae bacterium]|nr:hypothetical protein [Parvularculaceae bacterium]
MARLEARPREDGRGPYRWSPVVKTPRGFAQATIYRQIGDELDETEAKGLAELCALQGFQLRRCQ